MLKEIAPIPARKQDSRVWCGPAALQAVLARWGIVKSQADLAEMLDTTETEGTKPWRIVKAAEELGLSVEGRSALSVDDLAHSTARGVPVICNVQMHGGGHYVVVTDCQDGQVVYSDPNDGCYHRLDNVGFSNLWYDIRDGRQITRCGIAIAPPEYKAKESTESKIVDTMRRIVAATNEGPNVVEPQILILPPRYKAKESRSVPMATQTATTTPTALLDLEDVRQRDVYSCGAACACAVGLYFGVGPKLLDEWKTALNTTEKDSTKPQRIIDYFQSLGCTVEARQGMTMDDLRDYWRRGMPVIVCLQEYGIPSKQASYLYGHYVVVIGCGLGMVFVQDPSLQNVVSADHIKPHGVSDDLLAYAEQFLYETSPAHLLQSTSQFRAWLDQRGNNRYWGDWELTAALRIQSRQLGHTGADNVPGRMMIDETTWLRVWHDRDADGKPYVRFGIAVEGPPK